MPIDTRHKRSSAIHVGLPWRGMLPVPDGAIGQADRQHAATFYAGILAGETAEVPVVGSRVIRLMVGGGLVAKLVAGGRKVLALPAGGNVPKRLKIATSWH
jgi:hypothetical protein